MSTSMTRTDPRAQALAARWHVTTERLVHARSHFRLLNDAMSIDISAMRRLARMMHDLELEREALGQALGALQR